MRIERTDRCRLCDEDDNPHLSPPPSAASKCVPPSLSCNYFQFQQKKSDLLVDYVFFAPFPEAMSELVVLKRAATVQTPDEKLQILCL